jgi:enoyl-CoA hydratase/carnithine racemase
MPEPIEIQREGEIAVLRLRGGRANAMSPVLLAALTRAVDQVIASDARAAVVVGEGAAFSAGLALPDLIDLDRAAMAAFIDDFATAMRRVLECPMPVVAAINGHAIAGGYVLALMCDARLAVATTPERTPRIGLNEVQLGIGLPAVVVEPLRLRVPPTSLTAIALEGGLFLPEDALRLGLVDELVAPSSLESHAVARARALGDAPRAAYAQVKRAIVRPAVEAIDRLGNAEREAWLDTWFSAPAQQRLRAAVEKIAKRG